MLRNKNKTPTTQCGEKMDHPFPKCSVFTVCTVLCSKKMEFSPVQSQKHGTCLCAKKMRCPISLLGVLHEHFPVLFGILIPFTPSFLFHLLLCIEPSAFNEEMFPHRALSRMANFGVDGGETNMSLC